MSDGGTAEHEQNHSYRVSGPEISPDAQAVATTFDLRLSTAVSKHSYIGVQGSLGGSSVGDARTLQYGDLRLEPSGGVHASFGGLLGARITTRHGSLRGEVEVGGSVTSVTMTSYIADCVDTSSVSQSGWYVRPRIIADAWVTPWVTMGASLSSNSLRRGEISGGVHMGFHLRGWDGALGR
jgi:hypothetical protein